MWPLRQNVLYNKRCFFKEVFTFVFVVHLILLGVLFLCDNGKYHQERFVVDTNNLQSTVVFMPLQKRVPAKTGGSSAIKSGKKNRKVMSLNEYESKLAKQNQKKKPLPAKKAAQNKKSQAKAELKLEPKMIEHKVEQSVLVAKVEEKSPTVLQNSVTDLRKEKELQKKAADQAKKLADKKLADQKAVLEKEKKKKLEIEAKKKAEDAKKLEAKKLAEKKKLEDAKAAEAKKLAEKQKLSSFAKATADKEAEVKKKAAQEKAKMLEQEKQKKIDAEKQRKADEAEKLADEQEKKKLAAQKLVEEKEKQQKVIDDQIKQQKELKVAADKAKQQAVEQAKVAPAIQPAVLEEIVIEPATFDVQDQQETRVEDDDDEVLDLTNVSFVGSRDLEMLQIKEQIQAEIVKYYKPPVGINKKAVCDASVLVGAGGKATRVTVKKSSGSVANDMCARAALLKVVFPKEVIGKEIIIALGQ